MQPHALDGVRLLSTIAGVDLLSLHADFRKAVAARDLRTLERIDNILTHQMLQCIRQRLRDAYGAILVDVYRTASPRPVIPNLIDVIEHGKLLTAVIELLKLRQAKKLKKGAQAA